MGDAIARNAWPARIARDGTLHVNTADSVWAFELSQQAAAIAARVEVDAVKFAPGPLPGHEPERSVEQAPVPTPGELDEAERIAAAIEDENLRKTVEKAVSLALANGRSDLPV